MHISDGSFRGGGCSRGMGFPGDGSSRGMGVPGEFQEDECSGGWVSRGMGVPDTNSGTWGRSCMYN